MDCHKLGKTDVKVSTRAVGCWAIAGDPLWGALIKTAGGIERFIRAAVERSVQVIPRLWVEGSSGGQSCRSTGSASGRWPFE